MEVDEHGRIFGIDEEIGEMFADGNKGCQINFIC